MSLTRRSVTRLLNLSTWSTLASVIAVDPSAAQGDQAAPAINRGSVELGSMQGVVAGTLADRPDAGAIRIANGKALQAGLQAAASGGKFVEDSRGLRIEYAAIGAQEGRNTGLHVPHDLRGFVGSGPDFNAGSRLVQFARNQPAITLGDIGSGNNLSEGCTYRGFRIGYGVSQQGEEQASTIMIGRGFTCRYEDLFEDSYMAGEQPCPGMVGLHFYTANGQFTFSNVLSNIKIHRAQKNLLRTGAVGTGNVWENVYLGGGTFGSRVVLSGAAVHFANNWASQAAGAISQINIEWVEANQFLFLEAVKSGAIDSLRFEGCKLVGKSPSLIRTIASAVSIRALVLVDVWIGPDADETPSVVSSSANSQISIDGVEAKWSGAAYNPEAVISKKTVFVEVGAGHNSLEAANLAFQGASNLVDLDKTLSNGRFGTPEVIGRYCYRKGQSQTFNSVLTVTDTDFTSYGAHRDPTICYAGPLTADRVVTISALVSTDGIASRAARSNGDIVRVIRDDTATGTFTVIIRDFSGAVVGELSAAGMELAFVIEGGRPIR